MIAEHMAGLRACLETVVPVHDSALVTPHDEFVQEGYIVMFPSTPKDRVERYTADRVSDGPADFDVDIKVCGVTPGQVIAILDRIRTVFLGSAFVVPGRAVSGRQVEGGGVVRRDTSLKPGIYYADVGLLFTSRRG
ncbi:hypothetical protein [Microbacterium sp. YY-01]|uniref:hypothetical protein n=1 Tax=Microbacterium sp. YY-01 TaxID=3421634 RepID=UPI003D16A0A0